MRTEKECEPHNRYLFTEEIFSDESIRVWKEECLSRFNSNGLEKNDAYHKFINWERAENEIALFTLYSYADIKIPKFFNCIFELDNPNNYIFIELHLIQSIFEAWFPIERLDHGHKHLCIFRFENKIPDIFEKLHVLKGRFSDAPKGAAKLGICNKNDFEEIKSEIIKTDL